MRLVRVRLLILFQELAAIHNHTVVVRFDLDHVILVIVLRVNMAAAGALGTRAAALA